MNRYITALSLWLLLASAAATQFALAQSPSTPALEGVWQGRDEAGEVRIMLKVKQLGTAGFSGMLQSSLDPSAPASPTGRISTKDGTVHIDIDGQTTHWDGKLANSGGELVGTWTEGKLATKFSFKRYVQPPPSRSTIEGIWEGVQVEGDDRVRFLIEFERSGAGWVGALSIPDKLETYSALQDVTLKDGAVHFVFGIGGDQFNGTLSESGVEMAGKHSDDASSTQITFHRADRHDMSPLPQDPQKPYPYTEHDVQIVTTTKGVTLAGTLSLPSSPAGGPFPAVVMMGGAGDQDRDGEALGHKPFLVIADYLTRKGIAVLRLDDRGVGMSTGSTAGATTADYSIDLAAAVTFLKARPDIGHNKIGLVVTGEGAVIAPMAAARVKDVAFIALLNATGVKGAVVLLARSEAKLKANGAPDAMIKANRHFQEKVFNILAGEKNPENAGFALNNAVSDEVIGDAANNKRPDLWRPANIAAEYNTPRMRYFISTDPSAAIKSITCPVLAMSGDKDMEIPANLGLPVVADLLKAGGNLDVTIKLMPGLNHLLQTCKTGLPDEYASIDETIAPQALQTLGDWITAHCK